MSLPSDGGAKGIAEKFTFLKDEEPRDFQALVTSLENEYRPASGSERSLVESVATHYWLMQRTIKMQDELLMRGNLDQRAFSMCLRHQGIHERAFYRGVKELRGLQKKKSVKRKAPVVVFPGTKGKTRVM